MISITIYNAYRDATTRTNKYKRTVLNGKNTMVLNRIHWEGIQGRSRLGNVGNENDDTVRISIPFSYVSSDEYVSPKEFDALFDKSGYFTFKNDDKVCKGVVPADVLFEDLEKVYDDVVNITAVDTADYGSSIMQHWELSCK